MRRVEIVVRGQVQGVCFRMFAQRQASALGLTGWVMNIGDGSVKILAEGNDVAVAEFIEWCGEGSPYANVSGVDSTVLLGGAEFSGFVIRY